MEAFAIALFAVAVIGIPIAIFLFRDHGKDRGCGGGCAACANRDACCRNQQKKDEEPSK